MDTNMKIKYTVLILSLFASLAVDAQTVAETKARINSIKKNNQYLYADVTSDNEQDAKDMVEDELYENINQWAATKKKLRGSTNFVVNNKKELWTELKMPRGNMFRSFLYVKKSEIQGVDNATIIDNTSQAQSGKSSTSNVEEIYDFHPSPTLKALMACKKYEAFASLLKQKKAEGKVTFYGRYASLENPDIYFLAVYNRAGDIVAFLTPGPNRINTATKKTDNVVNYSGCGAIGFQINDK